MESPKAVESKSRRKNFMILTTILLSLLACILIALVYVFLTSSKKPITDNSVIVSNPQVDNDVEVYKTYEFNGEYVKATLPSGWQIKEYSDVLGMELYMENLKYTGLTRLEILDQDGEVIFSLKGIDGVGGSGACTEIGVFDDTESSYVETIQAEAAELGNGVTEIVDLTNVNYSPILFLSERFRRVGSDLYTSDNSDLSIFNTYCGIKADYIQVEGLGFSVNDSETTYSSSLYKFEITNTLSEQTLDELDLVLNSFDLN
jgi:hypothetical protein